MKKVLSVCLIALMLLGILGGCGNQQAKLEALAGTWTLLEDEDPEYILDVLTYFELYEEEIALVETTGMKTVKVVEFREDKTYSFRYDGDKTRQTVREYLDGVFDQLYESREKLDSLYEVAFSEYSQEEFQQFYAALYEQDDYDSLLDVMADEVYDYDVLDEPYETGTFTIRANRIYCTMAGKTEEEYLGYEIEGDTLTLEYLEDTEVYHRAN